MRKCIIFCLLIIFFLSLILSSKLLAQQLPIPGRKCEGSYFHDGTYLPAGQVREIVYGGVRYRCVGCGSCTPIDSGPSKPSHNYGMSSFRSTGDLKMDIMIMLFESIIQGFMKGLMEGLATSNRVQQDRESHHIQEIQRREQEKKKWEEEWRRNIEKQYREALSKYQAHLKEEFEKTKQHILGNIKLPKDSKLAKSLLCSKYWSKEAERSALSNSVDALEKAVLFNKKAEAAMSGDLTDCPDEITLLASPDLYKNSSVVFKNEFFNLVSQEERIREDMIVSTEKNLKELKKEVKKREKIVKDIEKSIQRNDKKESSDNLYQEALKALKEAQERKANAEKELERLKNEKFAIEEIKKQLHNYKEAN